jgi:hypothetical protein
MKMTKWKIRQESKQAIDYTGDDQQNGSTKEIEECQQRRRKEELQKSKEGIEKSHGQRQEGIS